MMVEGIKLKRHQNDRKKHYKFAKYYRLTYNAVESIMGRALDRGPYG